MSTLYKIELAALALGMLGGFFTLASTGEGFWDRLKCWWQKEHWLFCQKGIAVRQAMALPSAVGFLFTLYFLGVVERTATALLSLPEDWPFWDGLFLGMLAAFLVTKTLIATRYSGRQLAALCLVLGYFYILTVVSGYKPVSQAGLMMVALKDVDLKKCLRAVMIFITGNICITAALALNGLVPNSIQHWDNGRVRMDLGQGHANTLGILAAIVFVFWLVTRFDKMRWWDAALVAAGIWFIDAVPNSRTSLIFAGLALMGILAVKLLPRLFQKKWFQFLCSLPAFGIAAVMWFFHFCYQEEVEWMHRLDELVTGRLSLAHITWYWERMREVPFPFFGQIFVTDRFYRVDSSYIYYAYLCGPLMALLLCVGFALLTWKLMRTGRPELAICVMAYACYAMMERCLTGTNIALFFMPVLLFGAESLGWPAKREAETKPEGGEE